MVFAGARRGWCQVRGGSRRRSSHSRETLALGGCCTLEQPVAGRGGTSRGAATAKKKMADDAARCRHQRTKQNKWNKKRLTLDLERVSPLESIQTYSAMIWPFWSSLRYFWSCRQAKKSVVLFVWRGDFGRAPRDRVKGPGGQGEGERVQYPFWR